MALKIRLQRGGAAHAPKYRVVITEAKTRRDGRFVEKVGYYDPSPRGQDVQRALTLDLARVDYWMSVGAQPTETVRTLIKQARKNEPAVAAA